MRKFTVLALVLALVTSCSLNESYSNSANPEESIALTKEVKGTNGELIPITSSNVIAAGYDAQNQIMKVQFMSGAIGAEELVDLFSHGDKRRACLGS
jgi:enolase